MSRMTPRQRVLTALNHTEPDRIPFSWNFGPTPEMEALLVRVMDERGLDWLCFQAEVDDIWQYAPSYIGPVLPADTDLWGIGRRSQSYGDGAYDEISYHPLAGIDSVQVIADYPWPSPDVYDTGALREVILSRDPEGYRARKLAIRACGNPFEIYCWMTGLEQALINLLLNPALVHAAMTKITDHFEAVLRRSLAVAGDLIDICYFADDLGGQQTLLLSRRAYRKMIQPYHQRLFQAVKDVAPHVTVMYHSDGAVYDILPDVLDAGLEVLEAVQTDASGMDASRLKQAYGERLSFHGGMSVQTLLPHGDEATVTRECRQLVREFGAGGGYIAAPTHAVQIGTPVENILAMLRTVLGEADFEAAWKTCTYPTQKADR